MKTLKQFLLIGAGLLLAVALGWMIYEYCLPRTQRIERALSRNDRLMIWTMDAQLKSQGQFWEPLVLHINNKVAERSSTLENDLITNGHYAEFKVAITNLDPTVEEPYRFFEIVARLMAAGLTNQSHCLRGRGEDTNGVFVFLCHTSDIPRYRKALTEPSPPAWREILKNDGISTPATVTNE